MPHPATPCSKHASCARADVAGCWRISSLIELSATMWFRCVPQSTRWRTSLIYVPFCLLKIHKCKLKISTKCNKTKIQVVFPDSFQRKLSPEVPFMAAPSNVAYRKFKLLCSRTKFNYIQITTYTEQRWICWHRFVYIFCFWQRLCCKYWKTVPFETAISNSAKFFILLNFLQVLFWTKTKTVIEINMRHFEEDKNNWESSKEKPWPPPAETQIKRTAECLRARGTRSYHLVMLEY